MFKLSDFPFRGYLYFYIPVDEGNSLRESYYITKEDALRRHRNQNSDFLFRGFIGEIIEEVNLELVVSRPP